MIAILASVLLALWLNSSTREAKATDDHTNILIGEKLVPLNGQLQGLAEKLNVLQGRFDQLDADQKKATKLQLNKLDAQVAIALRSKKDIDPAIVSRLGEDVLSFAKSATPEISNAAWYVTTRLSDYRSFLNSRHGPNTATAAPTKPTGLQTNVEFHAAKLPGASKGSLGVLYFPNEPLVPGSQSAMFIEIGRENEVVRAPRSWVVVGEGFEIAIDGYHIRNTIVRDAHIVYNGGPLILENVSFVNCVFALKNSSKSLEFAERVVTQLPTSFQSS